MIYFVIATFADYDTEFSDAFLLNFGVMDFEQSSGVEALTWMSEANGKMRMCVVADVWHTGGNTYFWPPCETSDHTGLGRPNL